MKNNKAKNNKPILIIYGVSGSGKSTIGQQVANALVIPFFDADDFHPQANLDKMAAGNPLNDADRLPWLTAINQKMKEESILEGGVFACSALKEIYRQILQKDLSTIPSWFLLNGSFELIQKRMRQRDHFMPPELLHSQFEALEIPTYGHIMDITKEVDLLVRDITNLVC